MIESGVLIDEGMIYFNARLSRSHPTLEVRVADVCLQSEDAVLLAGLTRALVETAARAWRADQPPTPVRVELLRLAGWQAARSGLDGSLLDPTGQPAPAQRVARCCSAIFVGAAEAFPMWFPPPSPELWGYEVVMVRSLWTRNLVILSGRL